jgi:hypothetical protein
MKRNIISKILLSLGLVFVLGSAITQVYGDDLLQAPAPGQLPIVTIHSTGNVARGETGSFVVSMNAIASSGSYIPHIRYVGFTIGGSAVAGVDYVQLIPPALVGDSGYGTILVKTLADPRGLGGHAYSVIVKLKPGLGYRIGQPSSATMWIKP